MPSASKHNFIGIDLGGTNIKVGVLNDQGETLTYLSTPTLVEHGPDDATKRMAKAVHDAITQAGLKPEDIAQVGLGSPGTLDLPSGSLVRPSNLPGWDFYPIRDKLAEYSGLPVTFAHDGPAAGFAEYWVGAGKGEEGVILLTLGTGVGCGIVLEGRVVNGTHSHGGESGHILVDTSENARLCKCGQRGHLEAYASATGTANRTIEYVEAEVKTSLTERVRARKRNDEVPKMVFEEAEKGDEIAIRIVKETARYLAYGAVSLIHTLDPSCLLLGGAMTFGGNDAATGRLFLETFDKEVRSRIFLHLAERLKIGYATLGGDAGYIGAAGLARQEWEDQHPDDVGCFHVYRS
ncbi:MAG: ROK family protein [Planctomycetia bacterium]|nr:ROK family protein [Planctomycetia bacterium]